MKLRHTPGKDAAFHHGITIDREPPKELDAIADVVLNYRPKSKQPKPRKRKKTKKQK
ncbi:MAG TPA: hypothetical protein VHV32_19220 [Candidatus Angelobacter sp.]|jgi:hypothetical protein|nr:hypothetical protein [Candidatus Angelobacter sp.]